jgi:ParB-like chromosome segregation protein Spo0J
MQELPVESLSPNPWNTNRVSPDNEAKIDESIKRLGMFKPIVVRRTDYGRLEILGGQHRWESAQRLGMKTVPVVNLGEISDKKAKEIGLVDNGRYGADDTLSLAQLLEELGSPEELSSFMPYTSTDFESIFSSVSISLDALDLPEEDAPSAIPKEKPAQTQQVMRFKVQIEDAGWLSELIEKTKKTQRFTESDDLTNAGDALAYLLKDLK